MDVSSFSGVFSRLLGPRLQYWVPMYFYVAIIVGVCSVSRDVSSTAATDRPAAVSLCVAPVAFEGRPRLWLVFTTIGGTGSAASLGRAVVHVASVSPSATSLKQWLLPRPVAPLPPSA